MHPVALPGLVFAGALVGLAASFTGLGGGVLIVPLLVFIGMSHTLAVGTAFLAIFITSLSSLLAHARLGHVNRRLGLLLGGGGVVGAQLGAPLLHWVPEAVFNVVFAVILAALAAQLALARSAPEPRDTAPAALRSIWGNVAIVGYGFVVGVAAAFTGLGGGFLIVPLAIMLGLGVRQAVGTSFLGILIISSSALVAHASLEEVDVAVGAAIGIGGVLGAQVGPRLVRRTGQRTFRMVFGALLLAVAVRMVV